MKLSGDFSGHYRGHPSKMLRPSNREAAAETYPVGRFGPIQEVFRGGVISKVLATREPDDPADGVTKNQTDAQPIRVV